MLIKEVCAICDLTKKAVEYYENQGLLKPLVMDNGYRDYSDKEVAILKEISVLRKCGIGIQEIRAILKSKDKSAALARCRHLNSLKIKKLKTMQNAIDSLIKDYDIDTSFVALQQVDDAFLNVREKLVIAFPGDYGVYLSLHFGRFLDVPIETNKQLRAYSQILDFLDNVKIHIPEKLNDYLDCAFDISEDIGIDKVEAEIYAATTKAIREPQAFLKHNNMDAYIEYRLSEDFSQSPAGEMLALMTKFQKSSGYEDLFIANLKLISPTYRKYCDDLESANKVFLEAYPQAKSFYQVNND